MVNRAIKESGAGIIGAFPSLLLPEDGKFTAQQVAWIVETLQRLSDAINGQLSLGTGDSATRGGNFNAQWIVQFFTTGGAEVEIPHGLGRVPTDVFFGVPDNPCNFSTRKRGSWSPTSIWIACDTAGITVPMLIF